jgi:tight adherence protein C
MFEDATLALAALFASVFLAVLAGASLVRFDDPVRRRLAGEVLRVTTQPRAGRAVLRRNVAVRRAGQGIRARMVQAGITDTRAVHVYVAAQTILGIGAPAAALLLASDILLPLPAWQAGALLLALLLACFAGPPIWLSRRIENRQRAIAESFPDALDMMVVCVEAGLGLDAALARVGTQIAPAHPLLAAELERVTLELRAGKNRDDALRNFAARVSLPEVSSFITLLVQSEALGASIARTLRIHADDMRMNRLLRAEEMAHKLPVKLTVPLVICILPAMLVAVLLPAMLAIVRDVLPHLGR